MPQALATASRQSLSRLGRRAWRATPSRKPPMTTEARALSYILAMPASVAGQGGHDAAFAVAAALVHGFALDQSTALSVMRQWNTARATPAWSEAELQHKIESAAASPSRRGRGYLLREADERETRQPDADVAPEPRGPDRPRIPAYDAGKAERFAEGCRHPVTLDWLASRSPVPLPEATQQNRETAEWFLNALYQPGESVLVFTDFRSQGDFLWTAGHGGARLSRRRDVAPVSSRLPSGGTEGVWFLIQPVTGEWQIQPGGPEGARYGRRHGDCVTRWPFLLLESDAAPEAIWLRCLVQLPLRIAALYTSGGRSVHALVRVDAEGKAEYDAARDVVRSVLPVIGADAAAMTGVRLSRLPGCRRGDRLQRLVWLDPDPTGSGRILDRVGL